MKTCIYSILATGIFTVGILEAPFTYAAPQAWKLNTQQSKITFTATQNNAPVKGNFAKFTSDVQFDEQQLQDSHINVAVEMGSVNASYKELVDTLKMPDWFNVNVFPQATFISNHISKIGNNAYQADGNLTIRDKSLPVAVKFEIVKKSDSALQAKGNTLLKRTAFGVGQGEWSDTKEVKDEVQVNFILDLVR